MTDSMMSRFVSSGFEPVEVDGETVYPMVRMHPRVGDRLVITWLSASSPRVQGLAVRLRRPGIAGSKGNGGVLRVESIEAPSIMLWIDSAPPIVDIHVEDVIADAELQVSNRWRLADGREDEWLNNYGILIDEIDPYTFVLRCSDGFGDDLSFDDLVVRLQLKRG